MPNGRRAVRRAYRGFTAPLRGALRFGRRAAKRSKLSRPIRGAIVGGLTYGPIGAAVGHYLGGRGGRIRPISRYKSSKRLSKKGR